MWPFRRKKHQLRSQSVEVARGNRIRVFFLTKPNPGIRFPLEDKERVQVEVESRTDGTIVTVKFTPADDVVYDLVRSSETIQVWWDDGMIIRLPIVAVAWSAGKVVVTAYEELEDRRVS